MESSLDSPISCATGTCADRNPPSARFGRGATQLSNRGCLLRPLPRRHAAGGGPSRRAARVPRRRHLHRRCIRGGRGPGRPARRHPRARAEARQVRFRQGTDRIGGCAPAAEPGPADAPAASQGRRELPAATGDGGAVPPGDGHGNRGRRAQGAGSGVQGEDRRHHRERRVLRGGVRAGLQALPGDGPAANGGVRKGGRDGPRREGQGQRHRPGLHRGRARVQGQGPQANRESGRKRKDDACGALAPVRTRRARGAVAAPGPRLVHHGKDDGGRTGRGREPQVVRVQRRGHRDERGAPGAVAKGRVITRVGNRG